MTEFVITEFDSIFRYLDLLSSGQFAGVTSATEFRKQHFSKIFECKNLEMMFELYQQISVLV